MTDRPPDPPKRKRARKPKLCAHGYPAIPDPRGCAACWTKHPGYVKPKPKTRKELKEQKPPEDTRQVTCEKCFLPSQPGAPPLRRIITEASDEPVKYAHRACPSDKMGGAVPRKLRRSLRQGLARSLRSHMRKMLRIERSRRERAVVLRIETARAKRLLAAKRKEESRGHSKASAAG